MSALWTDPASWPGLSAGEVHVWLAHLPSAKPHLAGYSSVLSADEQVRASRFRFDLHRERWIITRGILRMLLARYLAIQPAQLSFNYNAQGKPLLQEPSEAGLHFNASHSGDYAAVAVTRLGTVGVDIETVRAAMPQAEDIARRYFAPGERAQWLALPERDRTQAFFQLWTCKEAFVKARGDGLFSGLARFEVSLREPRLLSIDGTPASGWWMAVLPATPGLVGGLVVEAAVGSPRFLRWNEALLEHSHA